MIKQRIKITEYQPITKLGDKLFRIMWDKEDEIGTEYCTCTIENIRMPKNGINIIDIINKGKKVGYGEPSLDVWLAWVQNGNPFGFRLDELKKHILSSVNSIIDQKILSGFTWKDMPIWLSSENQFNYKAAYDLTLQSGGKILPVVFKFGSIEEPIYYTFNTIEELSEFYTAAMKHISDTLAQGWEMKDSVDWSLYKQSLKELDK